MPLLYAPVFVPAFLITLLEMTEVVALVFALSAGGPSLRRAIYGALLGVAIIGGVALGAGAALERLPPEDVLIPSAVALAAFGVFLFRSTLRAYHRARLVRENKPLPAPHPVVEFGGGLTVGLVETTEAVIALVALAAPGYGATTLLGAVVAGAVLVVLAWLLHGQIRRIKVPLLKAGASAMLFTFAIFWAGEALGVAWPYQDLSLVPLFVLCALVVRAGVSLAERPPLPVETKS